MAKNIKVAGATYNNVPGVDLPLADNSGNMARFVDTTDATASASEIMQGYTAYGANGSKITGTATGGGASAYVSGTTLYITGNIVTPV